MLEQASLLVHGWTQQEGPWTRPISDAAGRPLGFVRLGGEAGTSWLSWFRKARLDVFETEDASHLMTVTRSWGMLRVWEVDDAEDRHVGTIYAKSIVTAEREPLASIEIESPERIHLLDSAGETVATANRIGGVIELHFAAPSNPFARMLALGCVLSLDALPRR